MKIHAEAYGKTLSENSVTRALYDGEWGIKLEFIDDHHGSQYRTILTIDQAEKLVSQIQKSIASIKEVTLQLNNIK